MTRNAYVLPAHKLVVFWTQKAACTAIVNVLCDDVIGLETISRRPEGGGRRAYLQNAAAYTVERALRMPYQRRWTLKVDRRRWLTGNGYYMQGTDAATLAKRDGYTTIAMIRDPYDRLLSAFLNKFVNKRGLPLHRLGDLEWFARDFYLEWQQAQVATTADGYAGISFHDMVSHVCDQLDDPRVSDTHLNKHWNTQIPPAFAESEFRYNFLFDTTRSDAFFRKLSELSETSLNVKHLNRSSKSETPARAVEPLVHANSISLADRRDIAKNSFDDPALKARVRHSFRIDYEYLATI